MYMFSKLQVERMQAALELSRSDLGSGLAAPAAAAS
jgi:hypothetical protein